MHYDIHTSTRTQYPKSRGRTPRRTGVRVGGPPRKGVAPTEAIKRARTKAARKIARKERETDV